ncbi:MAG: hypothetical protein BGO32_01785 [Bacteroidetes bacterium 37-13]|nr:MAG: hypothetical protein BGO32_01785 [Bacteroidetes bacterium 37-13]
MKNLISIFLLSVFVLAAFAHDKVKHEKKLQDTLVSAPEQAHQHEAAQEKENSVAHSHQHHTSGTTASFSDFPTLHPLVVHFPIVLLLMAFILQAASLFVFREPLSWVVLITLALGFAGAIVAGKYVHPHTTNAISEHAALVLTEHERFASLSIWLSGTALLFKIISHFILKRKLWAEILIALIMLGASICVSMAGHHGAQLVHIEGIGAQGNFLETNHKH